MPWPLKILNRHHRRQLLGRAHPAEPGDVDVMLERQRRQHLDAELSGNEILAGNRRLDVAVHVHHERAAGQLAVVRLRVDPGWRPRPGSSRPWTRAGAGVVAATAAAARHSIGTVCCTCSPVVVGTGHSLGRPAPRRLDCDQIVPSGSQQQALACPASPAAVPARMTLPFHPPRWRGRRRLVNMAIKVGINGFGRIGRNVLRSAVAELRQRHRDRRHQRPARSPTTWPTCSSTTRCTAASRAR